MIDWVLTWKRERDVADLKEFREFETHVHLWWDKFTEEHPNYKIF